MWYVHFDFVFSLPDWLCTITTEYNCRDTLKADLPLWSFLFFFFFLRTLFIILFQDTKQWTFNNKLILLAPHRAKEKEVKNTLYIKNNVYVYAHSHTVYRCTSTLKEKQSNSNSSLFIKCVTLVYSPHEKICNTDFENLTLIDFF